MTIPTKVAPKYVPAKDKSEESKRIADIQYDLKSPANMTLTMSIVMKSEITEETKPKSLTFQTKPY